MLTDIAFEFDSDTFDPSKVLSNSITVLLSAILLPLWLISTIIIKHFPKFWFRLPTGPLWELNRTTGQITIFNYEHKKKTKSDVNTVAPFYEFDAYIVTTPDRQGLPMNGLQLIHRYCGAHINLNALFTPDNSTQKPCALWDFLQNYMDVRHALPDIPMYEPYRHLDPVTALHDEKTNRKPRYWIDMDNDTFEGKVKEMLRRIDSLDTFNRPNFMEKYVKYAD